MNNVQSLPILFDSRSANLARVCLTLAKTDSKPASQSRNHGKAADAQLKRHPLTFLSLTKCYARRDCAMIQSP
jgi:hypothetical protein